jgi:hypothetical protein
MTAVTVFTDVKIASACSISNEVLVPFFFFFFF